MDRYLPESFDKSTIVTLIDFFSTDKTLSNIFIGGNTEILAKFEAKRCGINFL